jgi:hypothetical protein
MAAEIKFAPAFGTKMLPSLGLFVLQLSLRGRKKKTAKLGMSSVMKPKVAETIM